MVRKRVLVKEGTHAVNGRRSAGFESLKHHRIGFKNDHSKPFVHPAGALGRTLRKQVMARAEGEFPGILPLVISEKPGRIN
jgi:hypothetical protein